MLVSPAEPMKIKTLLMVGDGENRISPIPERWGCDFLFRSKSQWVGVQRKEISDLLASVADGRLGKELDQMKSHTDLRVLIVEGRVQWTNAGEMMGRDFGRKWTKAQFKALLWSVRQKGVWVEFTESMADTADHLLWLSDWLSKSTHTSLDRRPGPTSQWGNPTNVDYQRHVVMGLPGVGYELAERIVQMYGMPFGWNVSVEDLMKVPGIGKKKAQQIWNALEL